MRTRIKEIRKDKHLTQTEFGERIGLTQNSITLIETGKRNISDYSIRNLCREFNVNEEWLRTGKGEMYHPDSGDEIQALADKYHLSPKFKIFIEKLVNSSPEAQDAIVDLIARTAAALAENEMKS